ncbi:MAG: enoyl-CoA hydratase/isomerase family protein [Lautropia sp.]
MPSSIDVDPSAGFECRLDGRVQLYARGSTALIRMNRPDKRNALDGEQIAALLQAFRLYIAADELRAAVLTGAGGSFCSGGDIVMFQTLGPDNSLAFLQQGHEVLRQLETGAKPVIAAVNGYCLAGGLEVALACDFIVAGNSARFAMAEVDLGLIPGWGGTVRLARALPARVARQLLLTCERIGPERAQALGLVNEVLPDEEVVGRALALADQIARQPATAVHAARAVVDASVGGGSIDAALKLEAAWSAHLFCSSAVRERVQAWVARAAGKAAS